MTFNKQIQADLMELKTSIAADEIDGAGILEECRYIADAYHVSYTSVMMKLMMVIQA